MATLREVLSKDYANSSFRDILVSIQTSKAPEKEKHDAILDLHGTISCSIYFSNMTQLEPLEREITRTDLYKQATKRK